MDNKISQRVISVFQLKQINSQLQQLNQFKIK